MKTILLIGLGGGLGSILRYATGLLFNKPENTAFPTGTFIANIIGCFLIGLFFSLSLKQSWMNNDLKWFFITGFCGGYTTFSAFSFEGVQMMQNGNYTQFFIYTGFSIILGLAATWLGMLLLK